MDTRFVASHRCRRVVLAVLVALSAAATTSGQDRRVRSTQEILRQIERDWDAAFLTRNVAVIDNILAEDFVATYEDGTRGDRAKELSLAAEFNQKIEASGLKDFQIKIYGDTAVVLFTRTVIGLKQGQRLELSFQYIDVFVYRDGRWQCVASQSTRITG